MAEVCLRLCLCYELPRLALSHQWLLFQADLCCYDKASYQKQLGEERIYLVFTSRSQFISEGSQGRDSGEDSGERIHGGRLLSDALTGSGSARFPVQPRATSLGMVLPTVAWALLHQENIPHTSLVEAVLQQIPSFQVALGCVELSTKANQNSK